MFQFGRKIGYFLRKEITEIYITHSIRSFALSMIAIFVPIFLLEKGYSLSTVILYFLIRSLMVLFTIHLFVKFSAERGMKRSIIISMPLLIIFFVVLYCIDPLIALIGKMPFIILLSFINIIATSLYWMGFHMDFATVHSEQRVSRQISYLHAISIILSIIGPLIGAAIIIHAGYHPMFIVAIITLAIGTIPLLFTKDMHEPQKISLRSIFSKEDFRLYRPYFGEGFRQNATMDLWPILLFFLAISLEQIGSIYMLSSALLALSTIIVGKVATDVNRHRILNIGSLFHSVSLVVRVLLRTFPFIAAAQGLGGLSDSLVRTPYETFHYNRTRKHGISQVVFAREIYLHAGIALSCVIALLMIKVTSDTTALTISIILAALIGMVMITID